MLYDPRYFDAPYTAGGAPLTDTDVYLPIQEILEVDKTEFYNQLITDPETCFEIKNLEP